MTTQQIETEMDALVHARDRALRLAEEHTVYARYHEAKAAVHGLDLRRLGAKLADTEDATLAAGESQAAAVILPPVERRGTRVEPAPPAKSQPKTDGTDGINGTDGTDETERPATGRSGPREDPAKLALARSLPEPFTPASLGVALGLDATRATAQLVRWRRKGWVEKLGAHDWQRTPAFPKAG